MNEVFLTREEIEHPYANLAVMLEDKRKKAEQMSNTVFHCITASPEVLALQLVHIMVCEYDTSIKGWTSNIIFDVFDTYEEAIAATAAKLKEVVE